MNEKVLILGVSGMLGSSLHRYLSCNTGIEVVGTVRNDGLKNKLAVMGFNNVISNIDVTDDNALYKLIEREKPHYVLNCIGLIKQLSVSKVHVSSIEINSLLPHKLALVCSELSSKLIHFSTDCVFSGEKGMYKECDLPDTADLYGRSKLLGEVDYGGHLTLRTSIIGHELFSNHSLVDWFLNQQTDVKGFSNAVFSGLPTCYLAEFLMEKVFPSKSLSGLYHLSAEPIDKFSLLTLIKDKYQRETYIEKFPDFRLDRSLDSELIRAEVNWKAPSWEDLIDKMHYEYIEYFQ